MRLALIPVCLLIAPLVACSNASSKKTPTIYAVGDKATVGTLVYNLTDAETTQQLGDDPATARAAKERFFVLKVSISNSGNDEESIPAMTLVDESGQTVNEAADGTGLSNWLGVVRKVGAAQTEQGYVLFDAPIKHYRLRLNDVLDEKEIAIDVPLTFVRDGNNAGGGAPQPPQATTDITIPKKN
jgi:hypothetical protein